MPHSFSQERNCSWAVVGYGTDIERENGARACLDLRVTRDALGQECAGLAGQLRGRAGQLVIAALHRCQTVVVAIAEFVVTAVAEAVPAVPRQVSPARARTVACESVHWTRVVSARLRTRILSLTRVTPARGAGLDGTARCECLREDSQTYDCE